MERREHPHRSKGAVKPPSRASEPGTLYSAQIVTIGKGFYFAVLLELGGRAFISAHLVREKVLRVNDTVSVKVTEQKRSGTHARWMATFVETQETK